MRIIKLKGYHKEKYDANGCHYYIAIHNSKTDSYNMYPTSHYIDPKKKTDVKKGRAILLKIKGADGYSTVYKQARTKDVHGQPFRKTLINLNMLENCPRINFQN